MAKVQTISVLFTDMVGSTAMSSRVGPAAAEQLRKEYFALLRAAIRVDGGHEVKSVGDGLMVVFDSAVAAVDCAVGMQQRLKVRNRRSDQQLSVRMGLAVGDADHGDGDYFGPPVVEAARLCAKAGGGQILCTEMLRMMARPRTRHRFLEVGELELKGLPLPVMTYEIAWEIAGITVAVPLPRALCDVPAVGYVGREGEREALRDLFQRVASGERQIGLISGEAGIGKTRLATFASVEAHREGAVVLYGRCEDGLAVPFGPWVDALRHWVLAAGDDAIRDHVTAHGGELRRLLPELLRRLPDAPAPTDSDPETERYLLFGAVRGLLEQVAGEQPLVVVLDDLHWADKASLLLLRHLAAQGTLAGTLILATYRSSELDRSHPLAGVLADLRRADAVARIDLSGLDDAEVLELMQGVAGHELDASGVALAGEIVRETDGNPFFVTELLRHLRESGEIVHDERGRWHLAKSLAELGLPDSVREVVGRRIDRLDPDAVGVLRAAAVIGQEFDLDLLAQVTERSEDALLDLLEAAVEASVVAEAGERAGRFSFAHALVSHTLYDGLTRARRARMHRRVGEALERLHGSDPDDHIAELAHHWGLAAEATDPGKAIEYARRAGERALARLAPDEARGWFQRALDARPLQDPALRCELLIDLGEAQRQSGQRAYRRTLIEASQLAISLNDGGRAARAVLANNRGRTSAFGSVDVERVELLEAAVGRVTGTDHATRARLLSLLALELVFDPDYDHRRSLSDEALSLARRSGEQRALAQVLRDRAYTIWAPGSLAERRANADELLRLAVGLDDPVLRYWAQHNEADVSAEAGEIDRPRRAVENARAIAEQLRQPSLLWHAAYHDACLAMLSGPLGGIEPLIQRAVAIGAEIGEPDAEGVGVSQMALLQWVQWRTGEARAALAPAGKTREQIKVFHAAVGLLSLDCGRDSEARATLDDRGWERLPRDAYTTETLSIYALLAFHFADAAAASALDAQLATATESVVWSAVHALGAVDVYRGLLAAVLGRRDEADARLAAGNELNDRLGAAVWSLRGRLLWAQLLARRGGNDARRAVELLERARAAAVELGTPVLIEQTEAQLARAAVI